MLDTRTNEWLARLQSKGPNAVSIVLAVLIAAELARMAIALVGTALYLLRARTRREWPFRMTSVSR